MRSPGISRDPLNTQGISLVERCPERRSLVSRDDRWKIQVGNFKLEFSNCFKPRKQ